MKNKKRRLIAAALLVLAASAAALLLLRHPAGEAPGIIAVSPSEADGFRNEYLLYLPKRITSQYALVIPNNTGDVDDDIGVHREAAGRLMERKKAEADRLGTVLLVPVFPRPERIGHIYTHALDRDCLLTDEEDIYRLDLQLIAMIDDMRARLLEKNVELKPQVLLSGYSAAGMFANRFTLLHPDRVRAVAVGSPGGWPVAPVERYDGEALPYPLGTADLSDLTGEPFDLEDFRQVPQFFYIGDQDDNAAGETCWYEDMRELSAEVFGPTPVRRWPVAERIYAESHVQAKFKLYEGVGHEITEGMAGDVLDFLSAHA